MNPVAALILAGSRPGGPDPVAVAEGVSHKALARIGDRPLLARVGAALRDAGIARIAVAASDPQVVDLGTSLGMEVLPPAAGPSASVALAFAELGAPLLVTTADHGLLEAGWVTDFLADIPAGTDVAVLLAQRPLVEEAMPGSRRTWLRFADGDWSGCNLFHLATPQTARGIALWERVEADRKRPWRLAARLGPAMLASYALGRLGLADAVTRLGRRHGLAAAVVAARDGLAAVDVDKPADLADARRIVAARGDDRAGVVQGNKLLL
ncbi:nucleotidyltransferase family protein [Novosphingobium tardum]|uniref:Nucleotidyltransferase family protein n=1 Tax=Novosphingobium tardum TaxID=1538021 RepID=A0ABV8RM03_9SPHN